MVDFISGTLQEAGIGPIALLLAFLLGLASAVASACCTVPAMSMLVAYSGTREDRDRRTAFVSATTFLIGTTLALIVLGLVAGFVGQTVQALLGRYWKLFAGSIAIILGLAALRMLPVKLPLLAHQAKARSPVPGILGSVAAGLLLGGGVAACSLACNPGIFIVIGASILMGHIIWGMVLMAAFGLGFSLPLSAILFSVSRGKAMFKADRAETIIRVIAGIALLGAGFYFLASF